MANAYIDALRMLARRELSETQVRDRLRRRQHEPDEIDAAIERLRSERAIDDVRVAEAIARTETAVKRRGKLRVRRQIEQAGVSSAIARRVTDDLFGSLDPEALILASLARRLRGRDEIADEAEFSRLYRYLVGQGFEADAVLRILRLRVGPTGRAAQAGRAGRAGKAGGSNEEGSNED
jgi:regulatory protein